MTTQRTLAEVIRAIHDEQRARGFQGRSAEEIEASLRDDEEPEGLGTEWDCGGCGTHHDRDHNASVNLKNVAASLSET